MSAFVTETFMKDDSVERSKKAEYQRKWKAENCEKVKATYERYKQLNPERFKSTPEKAAALREWRAKNREAVAQAQKKSYQNHREKRLAATKAYRLANPEKIAEIARRARKNMTPERRAEAAEKKRITTMMRRYGLTPKDYERMLSEQGGCCALCPRTAGQERYKKLNVDHCHDTGKVRGLLCTPCNHAIGILGDTAEHLKKAVAYLER
jgi:actin-related protein